MAATSAQVVGRRNSRQRRGEMARREAKSAATATPITTSRPSTSGCWGMNEDRTMNRSVVRSKTSKR
ncbi:hypothetical protein J2W80_006135 [Methylorubrum extorquens]|nr:hypothetical protein [Methylorubrum extorquens]MCP1590910.1 hypothetical protein [Methylorubrum extorquens]